VTAQVHASINQRDTGAHFIVSSHLSLSFSVMAVIQLSSNGSTQWRNKNARKKRRSQLGLPTGGFVSPD
jgi:hypothetical protein